MGTRIQSRACGLNVEFHIELWFFLFVCYILKLFCVIAKLKEVSALDLG